MTDEFKIEASIGISEEDVNELISNVQSLLGKLSEEGKIDLEAEMDASGVVEATGEIQEGVDGATEATEEFGEEATDAVEKTEGAFESLNDLIGTVAAGIAGLGIAGFFKETIALANFQEDSIQLIKGALIATGQFSEAALKRQEEIASSIQTVSRFGDEALLRTQARLIALGATTENIEALTGSVVDFAAAMDLGLEQATQAVGRALAGQTTGLRRYGILIDEVAFKTRGADEIVDELAKRFGGQAKTQTETFAGSVEQLSNSWGDLLETVGFIITQDSAVQDLFVIFQEVVQAISDFIKENPLLAKSIVVLSGIVLVGTASLVAFKSAMVIKGVISKAILGLQSLGAQATVTSAQVNTTGLSLKRLGSAVGPALIAAGVAALTAIFLETRRINKETERIENQLRANRKKRADEAFESQVSIFENLERQGRLNDTILARQKEIVAALGRSHEFNERIRKIRSKIAEENKVIRDGLTKSLQIQREGFKVSSTLLNNLTKSGEISKESGKILRGQTQLVFEQLSASIKSVENEQDVKDAREEALLSIVGITGELEKQGVTAKEILKINETLLDTLQNEAKTGTNLVEMLEEDLKIRNDLVKEANELGILTDEQLISQLKEIQNETAIAKIFKGRQDGAIKRRLIGDKILESTKQNLTLQNQIKAATEERTRLEEVAAEVEDRKVQANEDILALKEDILRSAVEETETIEDDLELLNRRLQIELKSARTIEERRLAELEFHAERMALIDRERAARIQAADEVQSALEDNAKDLDSFLDGVEERIRKARGEGAVIELEKDVEAFQEQAPRVATEEERGRAIEALAGILELDLAEFEAEVTAAKERVAELNKFRDQMKEEYSKDIQAINAEGLSSVELSEARGELKEKHRGLAEQFDKDLSEAQESLKVAEDRRKGAQSLVNQEKEDFANRTAVAVEEASAAEAQREQDALLLEASKKLEAVRQQAVDVAAIVAGFGLDAGAPVSALPVEDVGALQGEALAAINVLEDETAFSEVTSSLDGILEAQTNFNETMEDFGSEVVTKFGEVESEFRSVTEAIKENTEQLQAINIGSGEAAEEDAENKGIKS